MNKTLSLTSALIIAGSAMSASAQDYSVGAGLSTFGPVIEGTYEIMPSLNVRGIGFIPVNASFSETEVDDDYSVDGEISTGAIALLADYYPTGQAWRISGGLFFAPDELLTGTFTGSETFEGSLNMDNKVAPMITGGYQYDFNSGWYLSGELGAIFSGFSVESDSTDPDVIADIEDINDELDGIPAYPYIAVTVGYTF